MAISDSYPPAVCDALLKPMENSVRTWFVLLARNRDDVRVAGQSRCFDYWLRPLNQSEAKAFLSRVFCARGLVCDNATLALLTDASGGLPGRLHEIGRIAAGTMPARFEAIRKRCGLGWAEDLASLWPEIVAGTDSALPGLMRSAVADRAEQVRRIQALLQLIGLRGVQKASHSPDAIDPALRHLDAYLSAWLAATINRKAIEDDTIFEAIWTRMAERWISDWYLDS